MCNAFEYIFFSLRAFNENVGIVIDEKLQLRIYLENDECENWDEIIIAK